MLPPEFVNEPVTAKCLCKSHIIQPSVLKISASTVYATRNLSSPLESIQYDEGKQKIMKRKRPLFDASKASTKGEKPKDYNFVLNRHRVRTFMCMHMFLH